MFADNGADSTSFPMLTTLRTIATVSESAENGSRGLTHPTPTGEEGLSNKLPADPNFPWGGQGPAHRHQNATELNEGMNGDTIIERSVWWSRFGNAVDRLKAYWQNSAPDTEEKK